MSNVFLNKKKYLKVSKLVKEVAPEYLNKRAQGKISAIRKLACCFVLFIGLSAFTGYKIYDNYNYQYYTEDSSYISTLGLPTDDYGFLDL